MQNVDVNNEVDLVRVNLLLVASRTQQFEEV